VAKLLLLSVVLASVALPVVLSRRPSPRRSIRRLLGAMAVIILVWAYLCLSLYPQWVHVE
jgi:hypothetical protein